MASAGTELFVGQGDGAIALRGCKEGRKVEDKGSGFRVQGSGFRVLGFRFSGFRVQDLGFRVLGFRI